MKQKQISVGAPLGIIQTGGGSVAGAMLPGQMAVTSTEQQKNALVSTLQQRASSPDIAAAIDRWSANYGVTKSLIVAVIQTESEWNPNAINSNPPTKSTSGSIDHGLMQINDYWLKDYICADGKKCGVDLDGSANVNHNICCGTMELRDRIRDTCKDNPTPERIYSAYNSGGCDKYLTDNGVRSNVQRFVNNYAAARQAFP